jgi:hypothetical protein
MQNDKPSQTVPCAYPLDDRGVETRMTASEQASCEHCGRPLTGRKQQFCSDRCRMAARRDIRAERIRGLLNIIRTTTDAIEAECLGRKEVRP